MLTITKKRNAAAPALELPRAELLKLLEQAKHIVTSRTSKPILGSVRLEASAGQLQIQATDLDLGLTTWMAAPGDLPPCIVPLAQLIQRIKAAKHPPCSLQLARAGQLCVNGGRVSHSLATLPVEDYPNVADAATGQTVAVSSPTLRTASDRHRRLEEREVSIRAPRAGSDPM